jgi:hypothetical protein
MPPARTPLTIERLTARGRRKGACLIWDGSTNEHGYGQVRHGRLTLKVHIVMADLIGLPGDGPMVLHACDNPPCFEPEHLYRGTQSDNMRDCVARGRHVPNLSNLNRGEHNIAKTHCPREHLYSGDNLYITKAGARSCKECKRQDNKRRRAK